MLKTQITGFPDCWMYLDCRVEQYGAQVVPYHNHHRGLLVDLWDDSGKVHTVRVCELINAVFPPAWRRS